MPNQPHEAEARAVGILRSQGRDRSRSSATSTKLPAWAALCFFASGAAGLLYEVAWSKQFSYLLGNSLHAVATVVAAFLAGLAIGARVLGVPLARRGSGPRTYALLEVGVALVGVLSIPLLRGMESVIGELYRALGGETSAFATARFVLLFVLLLPAAAMMGATLPVLVEHFEADRVGPALARLYALNTFGAVVGSVAGGFLLMPTMGLRSATWVAAALNVAVAALAWTAGSRSRPAPTATAEQEAPAVARQGGVKGRAAAAEGPGLDVAARVRVAVLFALSGFAALVFQIAWVRLFGLIFGSSVYSFSAVLGVYLFGIALGSALVARWLRGGASLARFGALQIALAVIAALVLHSFSRLPDWMYGLVQRSGTHWSSLFTGELWITGSLLIVPCALLGAIFPIATQLLQSKDGGHAAGLAYAVNTVGTIAGSLAAGFLLVPRFGVQGTHVAALGLSLAIGVAALAMAGRKRLGLAAIGVAAVVILVMAAPKWDPSLMSAGVFRPIQAMRLSQIAQSLAGAEGAVRRASRIERVLYYREGINGSVLVGTDPQGQSRWLRATGKIDASTGEDIQTQVLVGLLPTACADSGGRTLVIGHGSGVTTAAVLAAGAGPTDVIEIEPGVVEASRFFHPRGQDPLQDPRVHLVLGDARTLVLHGSGRYGLIVSEPSNPWIAGVNNLFTVDFYRRIRARLEPDGVFCQWMQLYELSPETFSTMVASFLEVFPEGQVFTVWRAVDVLLLAMPNDRRLALERLQTPAARKILERAWIESPEALAAYYAGPFSALRPIAAGAPLNRDDRPIVEYRSPRDLIASGTTGLERVSGLVPFAEELPPGPLFSAWSREGWFRDRARELIQLGESARAAKVTEGAEHAGLSSLARELRAEIEAGKRREESVAQVMQARALIAAGRADEARHMVEQVLVSAPTLGQAWISMADLRQAVGDVAGAEAALAHIGPDQPRDVRGDAAFLAGIIEAARQRPVAAAERFAEFQRLAPWSPRGYSFEARARLQTGDRAGARAALQRGLDMLPAEPNLLSQLADLGSSP